MKKYLITLLTLIVTLPALTQAAVRAWVNQNTVYEGDPVTLTIEVDGQSAPRPDLSVLNKSFQVLGTGTSTSVSIVNGRSSSKKSWNITLKPLGRGKLTIPAIPVGSEKTQPIVVNVTDIPESVKAKLRNHVILEAELDNAEKPVRVQQQIGYTIRLLTDDDVISGELIAPQIEDAVVEQIAADKRYQVTRNGKRFNVIERHYVISPERSGRLNIPPAQFRGKLRKPRKQQAQRRHSRSPFDDFFSRDDFFRDPFGDDFFNDDFFAGTPFGPPAQPIRTSSNALSIEVLPVPKGYKGKQWLPAEEVKIQDSWRSHMPEFKVGEPVVRSLRFQIKGLAGSQIPPLDIPEPKNMRVYPDPAKTETLTDGETVFGVSEQSITYIPQHAGKITIPAIRIDWWNTRSGKQESTTVPAMTVEVKPGAGGKTSVTPPPTPAKAPAATSEKKTVNTSQSGQQAAAGEGGRNWWPYLTLFGLIIAAGIIWRLRAVGKKPAAAPSEPTPQPAREKKTPAVDRRIARQALQQACVRGDAGEAAKRLLELARAQWPDNPPTSLGALADRLANGAEAVRALDRHLYGAPGQRWDGKALWEAVQNGFVEKQSEQEENTDNLQSLYPSRGSG